MGDETIFIIDWEHSHKSESKYWGFDIIHMIFIAIHYNSGRLKYSQKKFLRNCYKSLCDNSSSSNQLLERPFYNSSKYLSNYAMNFSPYSPIDDKYILAQVKRNELEQLDLMITKICPH